MGKGSRNREKNKAVNSYKPAAKKEVPVWVYSVVALVLAVAILASVIVAVVNDSGIIERNRVIVNSETGKYDINQQMATFLAWQNIYTYYYVYGSYGLVEIPSSYGSGSEAALSYAIDTASQSVMYGLRNSIQDMLDQLREYVAICDEAHRAGVKLDSYDKETVSESIKNLKNTTVGATGSFSMFLNSYVGHGMKESDVRKALNIVTLSNKYLEQVKADIGAGLSQEDLDKYRLENPSTFYKIDYLTYTVDTEELANQLQAAKTEEEFKNLAATMYFNDNYKSAYNKFTTDKTANTDLATLTGGANALSNAFSSSGMPSGITYTSKEEVGNEDVYNWLFADDRKPQSLNKIISGNSAYIVYCENVRKDDQNKVVAVSARILTYSSSTDEDLETDFTAIQTGFNTFDKALSDISMPADVSTYTKESEDTTDKALYTWLFTSNRKAGEIQMVTSEKKDGVYLVLCTEVVRDDTQVITDVSARVKFYAYEDGESYDGDLNFKTELKNHLLSNLMKGTAVSVMYSNYYTAATKRAEELMNKLNEEGANVTEILADYKTVTVEKVTDSTDTATLPEAVKTQVLKNDSVAGKATIASDDKATYLIYVKADETDGKTIEYILMKDYVAAAKLASNLLAELQAEGADPNAILLAYKALTVENILSSGTYPNLPAAVKTAALKSDVKANTAYSTSDSEASYVFYVTAVDTKAGTSIKYVKLENDMYYAVLNELQTGAAKTYPTVDTENYVEKEDEDAEDYAKWFSQTTEGMTSALKKFDTTSFTDEKDGKKTYRVYMITSDPLYLEKDAVYSGAYVKFTGDDAKAEADALLKKLQGKTGYDLTKLLSNLNDSAVVSTSFGESSFSDKKLKEWFTADGKNANGMEVFASEDGKAYYLAVYLDKLESWANTAKTSIIDEKVDEWLSPLKKKGVYQTSEKALDKLGEYITTTAAPSTTAAA